MSDKLDAFHWHEAIDRVETIRVILESLVYSHAVVPSNDKLMKEYDNCQNALGLLSAEILCEQQRWQNLLLGVEQESKKIIPVDFEK